MTQPADTPGNTPVLFSFAIREVLSTRMLALSKYFFDNHS